MLNWRYLKYAIKTMGYATGISWMYEFNLSYAMHKESLKRNAVLLPQSDLLYQIAAKAFSDMGVDLGRHPLQLSAFDSSEDTSSSRICSEARVYRNLQTGANCLEVDLAAFNRFQRDTVAARSLSRTEYYRAIFSHEAVHAKENHNFYKIYFYALFALPMVYLCQAMQMKLPWMLAFGTTSMCFYRHYVGQKFELRADCLAVAQDPSIRHSLISILSAMKEHAVAHRPRGLSFQFFHEHPSAERRLNAIVNSP